MTDKAHYTDLFKLAKYMSKIFLKQFNIHLYLTSCYRLDGRKIGNFTINCI